MDIRLVFGRESHYTRNGFALACDSNPESKKIQLFSEMKWEPNALESVLCLMFEPQSWFKSKVPGSASSLVDVSCFTFHHLHILKYFTLWGNNCWLKGQTVGIDISLLICFSYIKTLVASDKGHNAIECLRVNYRWQIHFTLIMLPILISFVLLRPTYSLFWLWQISQ